MKITIAAIIHVIKCKPPDFATSKEYALYLKTAFLSNKKSKEVIFESEKESLLKDLLRISKVDQSKLPLDTQQEGNHNNEHLKGDEHVNEATFEDAINVKSNIEYIEALVHIKNATNSKNSIPLGKFQAILSLVSQNVTEMRKKPYYECNERLSSKSTDPTNCFQSLFAKFSLKSPEIVEESSSQKSYQSQDSGYTSLEPAQKSFQNSYVFSSDINQVIRKNNGNLILAKSVQVVLDSLTRTIHSKTLEEGFWRSGSMLETSVKSIVKLIDCESKCDERSNCRDICSTFIKSLIETISSVDNDAFNLRCTVIRELSESPYICRHNISYVLDQIITIKESMFKKINCVGKDHFKMCSLDMVEEGSLFNLYKLLKELLLMYVRRRNKTSQLHTPNNSKPLNICAVWKGSTMKDSADQPEQSLILEWRSRLEELNEVFSEYLTHIMFFNFECLSLLEERIPLTDALDKG